MSKVSLGDVEVIGVVALGLGILYIVYKAVSGVSSAATAAGEALSDFAHDPLAATGVLPRQTPSDAAETQRLMQQAADNANPASSLWHWLSNSSDTSASPPATDSSVRGTLSNTGVDPNFANTSGDW